ncbi:MAG: hypothetical protein FWE80_06620, partial [Oscillospiraceae bacterium]|nr:hypothetical protein [Oscillospiraceae bacterium]
MRNTTCLNGFWDFSPASSLEEAPPAAYDGRICVPSPFNVNSFSHSYNKHIAGESVTVQGGDFRLYPEYPVEWDSAQAGYYRRTFTVPAEAAGQRVFLRFDAVAYRSRYWVNGQQIGEDCEGFLPIEWEITDFVKFGAENELVVGAERLSMLVWKDADGRNRCDYPHGSFWGGHIAGIWQDCWLDIRPAIFVPD